MKKTMIPQQEISLVNENAVSTFSAERLKSLVDRYSMWGCSAIANGVGVIPVYGAIGHGFWDWCGTDYQSIQGLAEELEENESVNSIVFLINSPGGASSGCFTCVDYLKTLKKPTTAFITGMACSAAYAIATACDKIVIEKDAETGCCGCYASAYEETEEHMKEEGFLVKVFRSAISPKKNLSVVSNKEAQEEFQAKIDKCGEDYLKMVAENRGVDYDKAKESFGLGAVVDAEYAVANGMVDSIGTWDELIESSQMAEESEGDDMDYGSMTEQEQLEAFTALTAANPGLLSETRGAERARVNSLLALKNGNAENDNLVNEAMEDGRQASDIALDLLSIANKQRQKGLEARVAETTIVDVPSATVPGKVENMYDKAADDLNNSVK